MFPYILIFVITAMLAFQSFDKPKVKPWPFFLYTLAIGTFVGVSDMLGGYDRYIYCDVFTLNSETIEITGKLFNKEIMDVYFPDEPLNLVLYSLIGYFTPNRYIFVLIFTLILYVLYAISFYRYTEKPFFALLVFLGLMFFFTFTYLRQVLAAGIVWLSLPYYLKRKPVPYFAIVLLAFLTHNSAGIMAALYFIPLKKWGWNKILPTMFCLFLLGLIGVGGLLVATGGALDNARIAEHAGANEFGFRLEYLAEVVVFLYILNKFYFAINEKDKESLSYLNLYLFFCGVLLLFIKSSDGGRVAWYGIMGIIIVLTHLCTKWYAHELRIILSVMFFLLYFRILWFWDNLLYPYKSFFTDGVRHPDYTYEKFEYDEKYKMDKFYNL